MREVMISIQPKWCKLICSGEKTIEVRKNRPNCELPLKCYIYCTKGKPKFSQSAFCDDISNGKVIGEFVCDRIYDLRYTPKEYYGKPAGTFEEFICENSCLSFDDIKAYANGNDLYGWHITDLVVYDEPRDLSEFYTEGDCDCMNCKKCYWFDKGNGYNVENDCNLAYKCVDLHKSLKPIIRPPQSWCYIEPRQTAD